LQAIEKATRQKIEMMIMPSTEEINDKRIARFKDRITDALAVEELGMFYQVIEQYQLEHNVPALEIAAALAKLVQGDVPLLLANRPMKDREVAFPKERQNGKKKRRKIDSDMERFRLEVGRVHGVEPGNIVGAIANEAGLDSKHIGRIEIYEDYSTVDLPDGMPRPLLKLLKKVWVAGQQLKITRLESMSRSPVRRGKKKPKTQCIF